MYKIQWFFLRLKAMSLSEILYRIKEKIKKSKYKSKYNNKEEITKIGVIDINYNREINYRIDKVFNQVELDKLKFNQNINIYGELINANDKINWHITNKGKEWNKDISSFNISFKDKDNLGELRYTWELNRHLFFSNLALQYVNTKDEKIYFLLKEHFYHWVKENPFLYGVNWMSPMEISIRAYQWIITYSIIKDRAETKFKNDILKAVINSIEYVYENFSKYSSANNHLIVEAAITSIIGYCLKPIYDQKWFEKGYNILKREIPLQVYDDGVNKEQATHYHAFVLDMMLQYNIFLSKIEKNALHEDVIFKMAEFIGYIYNDGNTIEFGDSDDAKIIDLTGEKKDYYKFVLQLASMYYKRQLTKIDNLYLEVKFLMYNLSDKDKKNFDEYKYSNIKLYSKGGYGLINDKKHFLLFDFGELGFGKIAAHGHADALALAYNYDNKPIFIDSGTYIYNVEKIWRNYFRKTENHNTLSVEGKSQSKIEGPFLWSHKAKAELINYGENENFVYFKAQHQGYTPYIHTRSVSYLKNHNIIIIEDSFDGKAFLNYVVDSNVKIKSINENLIKLNEVYFYSSSKIEIVKKYISKAFLKKEKTNGIKITSNFSENNNFSIISDKPIIFKDNNIIIDKKMYKYINYNEIRSEMFENS